MSNAEDCDKNEERIKNILRDLLLEMYQLSSDSWRVNRGKMIMLDLSV